MRRLIDQPISYGPYLLDTDGLLHCDDGKVEMLPRRLALPLKVLMEARGRTVTKDVLINTCWPRAEISDQSLARAIADLRKILKSHGNDSVKTVYGVGYRFDADPRTSSDAPQQANEIRTEKAELLHQEARHRIHARRPASLDVAEKLLTQSVGLRAQPADWLAIAEIQAHRIQLGYSSVPASWPRMQSAAERALKGSPANALSLLALGLCWREWDFSAAEEMLERARQIAPNSYTVNRCAGLKAQMVGNNGLAVSYFRRASASNPIALANSASLVMTLATEGKSNDAFAEVQQMVSKDAENPLTLSFRALAETRLGDPALAVTPAKQAFEALPDSALFAVILAYALAATGQTEPARELLERPSNDGESFEYSNSLACWAWLCMDDPRRALNTLHHSLERRCPFLPIILRDPVMAPISDDLRFRTVFDTVFRESHPSALTG